MFSTIDIYTIIFSFILFVILTPGVLLSLPSSRMKKLTAGVHAIIFALILLPVVHLCRFISPTSGGDSSGKVMLPRAFTMREGVNLLSTGINTSPTLQNDPTAVPMASPACPPGQNWISGSNPRHGYCSNYSQSEILSDKPPILTPVAKPSPAPSPACPPGQNWISGSNPRHGYCAATTVSDIVSAPNVTRSSGDVSSTDYVPASTGVFGLNPLQLPSELIVRN